MSEESVDPSGSTEQFRAFAGAVEPDAGTQRSRTPFLVGGVIAIVVIAALVWLAIS